jgi:hypothetical protein
MKIFTLSILLFFTGSAAFCQNSEVHSNEKELNYEKPKEGVQVKTVKKEVVPVKRDVKTQKYPMKVSSGVRKKNVDNSQPKPRTVDDVNREIASINSKMEIVLNDPEEKAIAEEEGWFILMNERLEKLNKEKEEFLNLNND